MQRPCRHERTKPASAYETTSRRLVGRSKAASEVALRASRSARTRRRARVRCGFGLWLSLAMPSLAAAAGDDRAPRDLRSDHRPPELVVAAAASLRAPLADAVRRLDSKGAASRILSSFGASSALARQIEAGAPIDVFLSADEAIVDALIGSGSVRPETRRRLATNSVVLLVSAAVAGRGQLPTWSDADVLRRIALPDGAVPLGAAGRRWLVAEGVLDVVAPRLVRTEDARATLAAVEAGHVDAAIVWSSDARLARHAQVALRSPAGLGRAVVVGVVTTRAHDPAAASAFLDALAGEAGHEAFMAAGFESIAEPR